MLKNNIPALIFINFIEPEDVIAGIQQNLTAYDFI